MLTAAQKRAKQKYREKNRERTNYLNARTTARGFIRNKATTTILLTATITMVFVHSNIFSRLYILRNIYNEILDIKEICSFLIKVKKNQYNLY